MTAATVEVTQAIIFSNRENVRNAVRQEFKANGLKPEDVINAATVKECVKKLKELPAAFLVLDWDAGPDKVLEVLAGNRGAHRVESHPTFLIAAQLDHHIMAVAVEYDVSKVHTGEVSQQLMKGIVKDLVREVQNLSPIRQLLINVEQARAKGDNKAALTILEQLAKKAPNNHRVALEFAEALMAEDRWDQAQQVLEKANDLDPPLARSRHLLARCYLKQKNHEKAIAALEGAQLINPYNIERLVEMGNLFMDIEKPKEAKATFDSILGFAPESKDGKLGKSSSMLVLGEVNEALAILKGSATPREMASVFNTAAVLSIRQDKHDTGLNLYKTAATVIGASNTKIMSRLKFNMGIGYVKWRKLEDGLRCFEEALKLDPEFEDARHNAEVVAKRCGKPMKMAVGDRAQPEERFGMGLEIEKGPVSFSADFDDDFDEDENI